MEESRFNEIIDDRYKILSELGSGGMAIVYKAHDLITDRDVAIKMMKPEMAGDKTGFTRFERETRAAASLNHQNIVKVVNVGSYKGLPYMVNELVNGKTLKEVLNIRGKLSFMVACDVMYQLCSAVMYAHQHGVIHRDIKPDNIFLTFDGTIKLSDFGIAIFQNATHVTRSDVIMGSVHYIAPEVTMGSAASEKSDIYSMGITFFELVTGKSPFDGDNNSAIALMHVNQKFPNIRKFNPHTPASIEQIIYKATKKDPFDRYPNVEYMRKDIEKILKNPLLLEEKHSFFYHLFHRRSSQDKERMRKDKEHRKSLKKAAKLAKKERV